MSLKSSAVSFMHEGFKDRMLPSVLCEREQLNVREENLGGDDVPQ